MFSVTCYTYHVYIINYNVAVKNGCILQVHVFIGLTFVHTKSKILIANNYYFQKECEKRGAFQSTVVIQSNSRDPDSHVVTHTLTDLVDGTTSTLYGKKVHASDVISAHYSQYWVCQINVSRRLENKFSFRHVSNKLM